MYKYTAEFSRKRLKYVHTHSHNAPRSCRNNYVYSSCSHDNSFRNSSATIYIQTYKTNTTYGRLTFNPTTLHGLHAQSHNSSRPWCNDNVYSTCSHDSIRKSYTTIYIHKRGLLYKDGV